jgi:hypothetical protein
MQQAMFMSHAPGTVAPPARRRSVWRDGPDVPRGTGL